MWPFSKRSDKQKLDLLSQHIESLSSLPEDNQRLFEWIRFLYDKVKDQERLIGRLQQDLALVPKNADDVKLLVDKFYEYDQVHSRIAALDKRVSLLTSLNDTHNEKLSELHSRILVNDRNDRSSSLKEKLLKRLTRNSKVYIKNALLSYIQKYERISALQLKDMIVEEQRLCSKSSFYRLLAELESENAVFFDRDGREKVYSLKGQGAFSIR